MRSLLLAFVFGSICFSASAQFDYQFWMPPIWEVPNSATNQPSSLFISTPYTTPVNVRVQTTDGTTFVFDGTVTSATPLVVPLTTVLGQTGIAGTANRNRGLIVTSTQPIQCVHRVAATNNQSLVTLKGRNALGTDFYCGSQVRNLSSMYYSNEFHFISVMATENNTQVTFQTPNIMFGASGALANPHTITLQAGESYLVRTNAPNQTVAGARVTSTKRIAVTSGSTHTRINGTNANGNPSAADAGTDQLVPVGLIGTQYAVIRGNNVDNYDYAIVVGTQNSTNVFIDGSATPIATINAGQTYDWTVTGSFGSPHSIRTDKPAYVFHVSGCSQDDEVDMSIMPDLSCTGSRYIQFNRFNQTGLQEICQVLIQPSADATLTFNGTPYASVSGVIVNNVPGLTGWKTATFPNSIVPSSVVLRSQGFFHVGWLTGNNSTGAYGYLSGFNDAVEVTDPSSGLPTNIYTLGPICQGQSIDHCIRVRSCGSINRITGFSGNDGTLVVAPPSQPRDTCFRYTAPFNFSGRDTVQFTIGNEFGFSTTLNIVFVVVNPNTPINAGADQQICTSSTATLTAVNPDPLVSGFWSVVQGTGVLATPNSPTTAVSNLSLGANSFTWTQTYPCAQRVDLVQVFRFTGTPPVAAAGPDALICSGGNATYTMQANSTGVTATGTWEITSGNATIANINSNTTSVSNIGIGVNTFRWNISNGPCAGGDSSDDMIIFVYNANHAAAVTSPDQNVCQGAFTSLPISATPAQSPATGQWTVVSGTASFANATSASTTVSGLSIGINRLRWTVNNGPCGNLTDDLIITVFSPTSPSASAGADQDICAPATGTTLVGSTPTFPATGTWTVTQGTGSFGNASAATTTVTGLSQGSNRFVWTVNNGACGTSSDEVIIRLFPQTAPNADAGVDQNICFIGTPLSISLTGNNPAAAPGPGVWSVVAGPGTISNPNASAVTATNLGIGTNTFRWTLTNGPCAGSRFDDVTITVFDNSIAPANAGPDAQLCAPTTTYTMQGNNVSFPAVGTWTLVSGQGTITNLNQRNTTITNLGVGLNVFRWSINNGPCGTTTDDVVITVFSNAAVTANAGADQEFCFSSAGPVNSAFAGNTPTAPSTGTWTLVSGGGTIVSPSSATSAINNLPIGTNTFRWTINNGACGTTTDDVVIRVFNPAQTAANAGVDQSICSTTTSITLNANTLIAPATGQWTVVSGTATFGSPTTSTTTVSGLSVGQNVLRWAIYNGPCTTPSTLTDDVVITVFSALQPTANAGADQSICSTSSTVNLNANAPIFPATGQWTVTNGTGTFAISNSPVSALTGMSVGTNTYTWTINNGACGAPTSDALVVTVFDVNAPASNAGPDQQLCLPTTTTTLAANAATAPGTGIWSIVSGIATIANPSSPNTTISGLQVGTVTLRWTINNGSCNQITSDDVVITLFDNTLSTPNAGPDASICTPASTYVMQGNTIAAPASGTWTLVSGSGTIANVNSPTTAISGLGIGANTFRWTLNNGACSTTLFDEMTILVFDQNQPVANAGADQRLCAADGNPVSSTLTGSALVFPGSGQWTLTSGAGIIASPTSASTTVSGLAVGENVFRWTVNNGSCTPANTFDEVSIFVYPGTQAAANAGADQALCSTNPSSSLNANAALFPAFGAWDVVQGTANFVDANNPNTLVSGLSIGNNILQWTIDNGPCAPSVTADQVTITVFDSSQPAANAGADSDICSTQTSMNLSGTSFTAPASGSWSVISGSATLSATNTANTVASGLSLGDNVFRYTILNGPCSDPSADDVVVRVFSNDQTAASAGDDGSFCLPTTQTTLTGNTLIAPATGQWTLVNGTGNIASNTTVTTNISGLSVGENTFRWTVNNGPCSPSQTFDEVSIFIFDNTQSAASAGPDQNLCEPITSASLTANAATFPATGQWTLVAGTGTIVNPTSPNTQVNNLGLGENVFRWTILNGPCDPASTSDDVSIFIFDADQPNANAGQDQVLCSPTSTATLNGSNIIFPATGNWTLISGTGSITNPNDSSSGVTGLSIGENIFEWTVNNGPCTGAITSDRVSIFVFDSDAAAADAGIDQEICTPQNSVSMAANAAVFPGLGTWTRVSGTGTIDTPNSATTTISNLSVGVNVFRWTIDNNSCGVGLTQDEVTITVFNQFSPDANAGEDQNLCTPTIFTTLAGNMPMAPATGVWTLVSGTGIISDPTNPNSAVTGLGIGPNVFEWTISNGPCANGITGDQVTITVFDGGASAPFAGDDQELCSPNFTTTMQADAAVFPGIGTWNVLQGTGTFADANDHNTTLSGLTIGVNRFRWSVNYSTCGSPQDDVTITVYDSSQGASDAGSDQDLCTPNTTTDMTASAVIAPGFGTWSVVEGAGAFADVNDPTSQVTNLSVGDNVFVWTIYNGPCLDVALTTDTVRVRLFDNNNPVANAGSDQSFCSTTTSSALEGSAITYPASGTWTLVNGTGTIADPSSPTSAVSDLTVGENIFRWTVNNGPCAAGVTTDDVSIFIYPDDQANADAGVDQSLCTPQTSTTLNGNAFTFPATGTWTLVSGSGTIADANDPTTAVSNLGIGENVFQWTIDNGSCSNGITTDVMRIFVFDENNPNADGGLDQEFCLPTNSTSLEGSPYTFPATGTWARINGGGTISNVNNPEASITGLPIGINTFVWTIDNGVCANGITTDTVNVVIYNPDAAVATAGNDQELCTPNSSTTLTAQTPDVPGVGTWTVISSPSIVSISDVNDPSATITGLTVGETILQWTVYNGPCAVTNSTDQVSIFLFDATQADANAGPEQNICTPQTSVTMAANSITFPATGEWTLVSGAGVIADASNPSTAITDLAVGANVFRWTVDNGPCANGITTSDVTINVFDNTQANAAAGNDQEFCLPTTSASLNGSAVVGASVGTWSVIAGTGTFTDINQASTQVTNLSQGINTMVWSVNNGTCGSSSDTLDIRIYNNNAPEADAGEDASFCTPVSTYILQGNSPETPGVGTWAVVSGPGYTSAGTISDVNNPNAEISGLVIGENVFSWTIYNGPCEDPTTDFVSIFIFDENQPSANAGDDIEICLPIDQVQLAGNAPVFPATGIWTQIQGTAANITAAADSATTVTELSAGTNLFVWTLNNGACNGALTTDTMEVRVFGPADAPFAGDDQSLCTPVSSATMNAAAPVDPRFGTWTLIQGSGTIADVNDPNTTITDLAVGENCFLWTVYNGTCGEPSVDIVCIYIYDDSQAAASAGPDQSLCTPNFETQLGANSVIFPATGTWQNVTGNGFTGAGTLTDVNDPQAVVSGLQIGFNAFVWTIDNGACANAITSDTIVIALYNTDLPPANAGEDQFLCLPLTTTTLNGSFINGAAVGTWSLISGGGTIVSPNTSTTDIIDLPVGINIFTWTVDNGLCAATIDTVRIQVNDPNAPVANAGDDASYCTPTSTHIMTANTPTFPSFGTWTRLTGSGEITDASDATTEIYNLTTGENIFVWCIDNGACNAPTCDVMSIFIYNENTPDANAGEDIELCLPVTEINMNASSAEFPAIGTWQVISEPVPGSTVVTDVNAPQGLMTNLQLGTTIFTWTVFNGPCPNSITVDTVEVRVFDPGVAQPDAGENIEVCTPQTTVTMNGSIPNDPNYGFWTLIQGTGTITEENNPNSTVTGLAVGINALTWTYYNGNCEGPLPTDTVYVRVYDQGQPAANAGDDQEVCLPQNFTQLTGNALTTPATGQWELVSGFGIITDPTSPTSTVTSLAVGTNLFAWTISNGPCENSVTTDTVAIRVFDPTINDVTAGNDLEICTPQSCVTMTANALPNPQVGSWTYISAVNGNGPVPFGGIADINNATTEICGLVVGVHTLQWGVYNGPCDNGGLDQVRISVFDNTAPAANAGDDIEICAPESTITLSANSAVFPGVGTWSILSGNATLSDVNDPAATVNDLSIGIVQLMWSIYNGPCNVPTTDTLEIRVYDPNSPNAQAGPDAEYCLNFASHVMAANAPIFPAVGTWTTISGDGQFQNVNDPTSAVINIPLNENVFVWTIDNGACANGITTDTVAIYVNDINVAAANAGEDLQFCGAPDSLILNASVTIGLATGSWTLISGSGTFDAPDDYRSVLRNIGTGVNEYLWTVDNGACGITSDTLTIVVFDPEESVAYAGESESFCENDFVSFNLQGSEPLFPAFGYWSILDGNAILSDTTQAGALVVSLSDKLPEFGESTSTLVWTVDNGVCGITSDTVAYQIKDCLTIKIPDAFSPNGDGTNDFFVIPNIANYPKNSLKVFNRWGAQIYEAAPYQNMWDGRSHHPTSLGEELPVSTYYYILDLGTGEEAFTGFVYLKR